MTEILDNLPDPLDAIVEDFLDRRRAGEAPSTEEYTRRYPELAERIRALFPTLLLLEGAPTPQAPSTGSPCSGGGELPAALGPFRIVREVGRGGMGVVYEAVQEPLGRRVALKVLPPEYARRPGFRERFQREAAAAARLHHTNIVPVFASGECDGTLFFAMQYIDGRTAAELLAAPRGGTAPAGRAREVARLGLQAAEALAYAHAHGILHRDVKPANLLVDEQETLWVADFGLAKAEGSDDLTGTGELVGTLRFLAPERFEGVCDARSDVYALGVTLYELLALRPAFDEADRLQLVQRIGQGAEPLRRRAPWVPADLETVVHKALTVEPAGRYATARELAEDLRRFLDDQPVRARRLGPWGRLRRWARRRPAVAALLALVALVSAAGLAGVLLAYGQAVRAEKTARDEAKRADDKAAEAQLKEKEALWQAHLARLGRIDAQLLANDHAGALQVLDQLSPEYRGWEYGYLRRRIEGTPLILRGHEQGVTAVCYSSDGTRLASASLDRTVKLWDAKSGAQIATLRGHTHFVFRVAYSPDGTQLASASDDKTVKLWDAKSGAEIATLRGHTASVLSVAYSPDGTRLASGSEDKTVKLWDAKSGAEVATLRGHTASVLSVAYSPDGSRLASAAAGDDGIKLWDARSGTEIATLRGHGGGVHAVCYSPDGTRLASASEDKTVKLWDAQSGAEIATLRGHTESVHSVAYSPDGSRLASASWDRTVKLWDAKSGAQIATLRGHTDSVRSVAYSPDGTRLASGSGDQTVKFWDAISSPQFATLRGHTSSVCSVAYSPDGSRLASASLDRTVKLWDAKIGAQIATLRGHTDFVFRVAYSPDGTRLASASQDHTIKLWDAKSGAQIATLRGHTDSVDAVAFSPDGTRLASVGGALHKPGQVKIWDAHSGAELASLRGHADWVRSVVYSPDGTHLATASNDTTVKIWDAHSGVEFATLRGHTEGVFSVAYSPDGTRLASASADQTVRLWDASSGAEIATLRGHTAAVRSLAFSPDGTRLVSVSDDDTVKVWHVLTGIELATLRGHTDPVFWVAYSPDGTRLATGSYDKTLTIWDNRSSGKPVTLRGHLANVRSVGYSADGTRIVSTDELGRTLVWDAASGQPLSDENPPQNLAADNVSPDGLFVAVPYGAAIQVFQNRPVPGGYDPWAEDRQRWRVQAPLWHAEQAKAARQRRDAFAAAFHRRCLSEGDNLRQLAWAQLAAGDSDGCRQALQQLWDEQDRVAARWLLSGALASGLALQPVPAGPAGPVAAASLGRREEQRRAAELVRAAALWSGSSIPPAELRKRAEICVEADPQSWQYHELLGAALYRDSQAAAAVEQLQEAVRLHGAGGSLWTRLFMALAHHHLGQAQEAQQWRRQAEQAGTWEEAVMQRLLLAELDAPAPPVLP
jgi:WD40 repeat protein